MKGLINSIETLGTLDGPGIRFVVFFQGCKLRCLYCHNPETWKIKQGELLLVLPLEEHLIDSEENNDLLFVEFGESFLGQEFSFFLENDILKRKYFPDDEMKALLTSIEKMRSHYKENPICSEWDNKATLYTFASKLVQMLEGVEKTEKKSEEKKKKSIVTVDTAALK